jgi:flagellar protein FlaG
MISAISGLPAIVIEGFREVETGIDLDSRENSIIYNRVANADTETRLNKNNKNNQKELSVSFDEIKEVLQEALKEANLAIEFSVDKDLNRMIMKLVDSETNEVIRQLPPDITLKIARIVASALGNGSVADAKI